MGAGLMEFVQWQVIEYDYYLFLAAVMIGFTQNAYNVEEDSNGNGAILEVCVQVSRDLDRDVDIYITTSSQTAEGDNECNAFLENAKDSHTT